MRRTTKHRRRNQRRRHRGRHARSWYLLSTHKVSLAGSPLRHIHRVLLLRHGRSWSRVRVQLPSGHWSRPTRMPRRWLYPSYQGAARVAAARLLAVQPSSVGYRLPSLRARVHRPFFDTLVRSIGSPARTIRYHFDSLFAKQVQR